MNLEITNYLKTKIPQSVDTNINLFAEQNKDYRVEVVEKSKIGDQALLLCGEVGNDNTIVDNNGQKIDLVKDEFEYYCTDIIFVEKDHKKAIKMLLRWKAENPGKKVETDKLIKTVGEYSVWLKNEKIITDSVENQNAYDEYAKEIKEEILLVAKKHLGKYYSAKQLEADIMKPVINYYLNPTDANFNSIVSMVGRMAKESRAQRYDKMLALIHAIEELSSSLGEKVEKKHFNE